MIRDDLHYMSYADSHNKVYGDDDKLQWGRDDAHHPDNLDGAHIRNHRS